MLIEHLTNPNLETKEKLLLTIFHLGMADRKQLSALLKVGVDSVDKTIINWNKKNPDEKHVISLTAPFTKGPKLYQLGPAGWKWVMELIQDDRKYKERSDAQKRHYRGMTDILVRLVKKLGYEQLDEVRYYNTREAGEQFRSPWNVIHYHLEPKEKWELTKDLPEPDLLVGVGKIEAWTEYDTGTESPDKIRDKVRRYFRAYKQLGEKSRSRKEIIWVAPTQSRVKSLKSWFEMVSEEPEFKEMELPPKMYFFVEGEEISYFLDT